MRQAFAALFICLFSGAASAQVTVPNTFSAGSPARAAEVNANFSALATAINDLATRVTALESPTVTAASVVGTYRLQSLELGLAITSGTNTGSLQVSGSRASGTITLNAGGTTTGSMTSSFTNARISASGGTGDVTTNLTRTDDPENVSGTWTVSNGQVVITDNIGVAVSFLPASARLLLGVGREVTSSDFYWLDILVKQ